MLELRLVVNQFNANVFLLEFLMIIVGNSNCSNCLVFVFDIDLVVARVSFRVELYGFKGIHSKDDLFILISNEEIILANQVH